MILYLNAILIAEFREIGLPPRYKTYQRPRLLIEERAHERSHPPPRPPDRAATGHPLKRKNERSRLVDGDAIAGSSQIMGL